MTTTPQTRFLRNARESYPENGTRTVKAKYLGLVAIAALLSTILFLSERTFRCPSCNSTFYGRRKTCPECGEQFVTDSGISSKISDGSTVSEFTNTGRSQEDDDGE